MKLQIRLISSSGIVWPLLVMTSQWMFGPEATA
jgi:hypothetical protein